MSVSSVNTTVDTTGTATASSGSTSQLLNMDSFMNLLVTQLKFQDPLDPMKTNEFMSQLAALTTVERLQNIYDSLTDLATTTETGNLLDMIGKKIQVDGNVLSKGDEYTVTPSADYDKVAFSITNLKDGSVETVTRNKGDSLTYTNEGSDTLKVTAAVSKEGAAVESTASAYRTVTGVKGSASSMSLVTGNGEEYAASSITMIKN